MFKWKNKKIICGINIKKVKTQKYYFKAMKK